MNFVIRTVDDYKSLITSEHADKPKYMATIGVTASISAYLQELAADLPRQFDLDEAVGVQLDAVGEWIGRSRRIDTPLTGVYFTWDDVASTGWDNGVWQGEFDPDSGLTVLPDDEYRLLLRAKVAANQWDGTIPGAYDIWTTVFPDSLIIIQDNQDMSMTVGVAGSQLSTVTQALLTGGYIPLKPEGVRVNYYAISVDSGPLFAWDAESEALAGWDTGSWALELPPT